MYILILILILMTVVYWLFLKQKVVELVEIMMEERKQKQDLNRPLLSKLLNISLNMICLLNKELVSKLRDLHGDWTYSRRVFPFTSGLRAIRDGGVYSLSGGILSL